MPFLFAGEGCPPPRPFGAHDPVGSWSPGQDSSVAGTMTDARPNLSKWIRWMMTPNEENRYPIHITYVSQSPNDSRTTAWAFTTRFPACRDCSIGLIMAIGTNHWRIQRAAFRAGGVRALCAAFTIAEIVLHEMVHIAADGYDNGTSGENSPYSYSNPDWDKPGAQHDQ